MHGCVRVDEHGCYDVLRCSGLSVGFVGLVGFWAVGVAGYCEGGGHGVDVPGVENREVGGFDGDG